MQETARFYLMREKKTTSLVTTLKVHMLVCVCACGLESDILYLKGKYKLAVYLGMH